MSRRDEETGSAAVELTLYTPVLILLLVVVVLFSRMTSAKADVIAAARDGARAASLNHDPASAARAARSTVRATLDAQHVACSGVTTEVDASKVEPGGAISVTVSCVISMQELTGFGLTPGNRTVTGRSTAVIDTFRGEP